jgi:hypothetical protein
VKCLNSNAIFGAKKRTTCTLRWIRPRDWVHSFWNLMLTSVQTKDHGEWIWHPTATSWSF